MCWGTEVGSLKLIARAESAVCRRLADPKVLETANIIHRLEPGQPQLASMSVCRLVKETSCTLASIRVLERHTVISRPETMQTLVRILQPQSCNMY